MLTAFGSDVLELAINDACVDLGLTYQSDTEAVRATMRGCRKRFERVQGGVRYAKHLLTQEQVAKVV